jgi:hypothetical protein
LVIAKLANFLLFSILFNFVVNAIIHLWRLATSYV